MASTALDQLNHLVAKRTKELALQRGLFRKASRWIRQWLFVGPRVEIAHDWQVVNQFAERAKQRFVEGEEGHDPAVTQPARRGEDLEVDKKYNLVEVLALLGCAKTEADFAQAWSYINCADATLPLIVSPDEQKACTARLETADRRLPDEEREVVNDRLDAHGARIIREVADWMDEHHVDSAGRKQVKEVLEKMVATAAGTTDKMRDYSAQLTRTLLWNNLNRQISLKLSLWRSIRNRLAFALLALFGAVALWPLCHGEPVWKTVAPFVEIALLGFFGGTLSAFLVARDADVNIPSYELIRARTSLRMLLGAAGALVVYSIGLWLLDVKVQNLIRDNLLVFMSIGIVAGFSERLFINTLEKAAQNLHLSGSPTKPEDKANLPPSRRSQKKP